MGVATEAKVVVLAVDAAVVAASDAERVAEVALLISGGYVAPFSSPASNIAPSSGGYANPPAGGYACPENKSMTITPV